MLTAAAQRCAPGEDVCGDVWSVVSAGTASLLTVIDGLGHGPPANQAAQMAKEALERRPNMELTQLVTEIGEEIKSSRGVCLGVARVDLAAMRLSCVIVGNVEIVGLGRQPIHPLQSPGIVGRGVRKLRLFEAALAPGDRLYLYSDGVSRKVNLARYRGLAAEETAHAVVRDFGSGTDDVTCLVADLG